MCAFWLKNAWHHILLCIFFFFTQLCQKAKVTNLGLLLNLQILNQILIIIYYNGNRNPIDGCRNWAKFMKGWKFELKKINAYFYKKLTIFFIARILLHRDLTDSRTAPESLESRNMYITLLTVTRLRRSNKSRSWWW